MLDAMRDGVTDFGRAMMSLATKNGFSQTTCERKCWAKHTEVPDENVRGLEAMLGCDFDDGLVLGKRGSGRPERGVRLRADAFRAKVREQFVLGIVDVELQLTKL
jgi:hypothetical protein